MNLEGIEGVGGALMRCSSEEMVEILMEAAVVGEEDNYHGIAENVMIVQMAPMGTGVFEVAQLASDMVMLKNSIIGHCLGVQHMLAAQSYGGWTPGQVAMMLYEGNSFAVQGRAGCLREMTERAPCNQYVGFRQSLMTVGGMSPGSEYSPNAFTGPYATLLFHRGSATSPTYS